MRKTCKDCIWGDRCGSIEICEDFSPIDDSGDNEAYYVETLKERYEDYAEVIEEYK